jgi:ribonuclease P protein component
LLHRPEFERVYRNGKRRSSRLFAILYAPNGLSCSRFGMSVGRALGGAVVRNRIRRRVREVLRRRRQEISSGWDIILHPRGTVATANFADMAAELVSLLQSAVGAASPVAPDPTPETLA